MSSTSGHHHELTDGKGKCSVPMWCGGLPAGFCDRDAFGNRPDAKTRIDPRSGEAYRFDLKYAGYVPGLACPVHGGPEGPE